MLTSTISTAVELRPYQIRALEDTRAAIRSGQKRVLLAAPTGSGKTTIAAEMMHSAKERGRRTLFLAHRKELLKQCRDRLSEFGLESSIIRADDPRLDPAQPIQIASVQTLVRRLEHFAHDDFDLIVVDEAHHGRADTYGKILEHFSGAKAIVGLTATPCRKDGRGLAEAFDVLVEAANLRELIGGKYLVPIRMFSARVIDLAGVHRRQGDYALAELGERMDTSTLVGNILREWQRLGSDRRTVIFATTVAHSKSICTRFHDAGVSIEHLDGDTPNDDRDAILARVRTGETQVISNCQILTEGWDLPAISSCVIARPTKSLSLYLQMAGRALRPAPGKVDCLILDHGNTYREHGTVDQDRHWTLTGDRPMSESGAAPTKCCPNCGFIMPTAIRFCPECDFEFIAQQWSGKESAAELVEVNAGSSHKHRREIFLEIVDNVRNARRRDGSPYQLNAALVKYKDQFGAWPPWSWQREAGIR